MKGSSHIRNQTYKQFHLRYFLVNLLHELYYEVYKLVLQHLLGMEIGYEEGYIITLTGISRFPSCIRPSLRTGIAFLRRMRKASALCVRNLVNLCTKMCSISSACLILILIRTLFTLGSMKTLSFSFRETVSGFSNSSGELAASISGTLCRSDVCDAKSARERAAVRDERTHWRYGRSD